MILNYSLFLIIFGTQIFLYLAIETLQHVSYVFVICLYHFQALLTFDVKSSLPWDHPLICGALAPFSGDGIRPQLYEP